MERPEPQTEICNRCNKKKLWTDIYELADYEMVCVDCMTEKEKEGKKMNLTHYSQRQEN